jgi:hypothetical protein
MKSFAMMLATAALSLPLAAFAQTDSPLTRAQVRADLQQLERAGYAPSKGEDPYYPQDIQAAEARVSARSGATSYGGVPSGATQSGSRVITRAASPEEMKQLYFGGQ